MGETQTTSAANIVVVRKARSVTLLPEQPDTIRNKWGSRYWNAADRPSCLIDVDFQARLYPYLPDFVRWLEGAKGTKKVENAAEAIAFIRYRFLRDAHALGLYRPYSEGRLALLLTWMYLPDVGSEDDLSNAKKASFILAFNNDVQLYRHMTVLVDRMIHNRVNQVFLRPLLPRISLLMILYGDYQWSIDICEIALQQSRNVKSDGQTGFIIQELEVLRADAESHLQIPADLEPCHALERRVNLLIPNYIPEGKSAKDMSRDQSAVLRMALCAYFRALVRVVMYLRSHCQAYDLPSKTEAQLDLYRQLAEEYEKSADQSPWGTDVVGGRLCQGRHYIGLDFDTLARAEAVLRPELLLESSALESPDPSYKQKPANLVNNCREGLKKCLSDANDFSVKATRYFKEGDESDQIVLDTFKHPETVVLTPREVKVENLSTYRKCSTGAVINCYEAMFARSPTIFKAALGRADAKRKEFEKEVGVENLRHARILNERLKSMITFLEYGRRHEWIATAKWIEQ